MYQASNLGRVKSLSRIIIDRRGIPHYVNESGRNGRVRKIICDNTPFSCIKDCDDPLILYSDTDTLFYGNPFW